ncbi:hypothetical protein QJS10_CPB04g00075 [Acorus calamus]|uniref:Uncharacterized protein n=1 Tax=Acorus calamus TaxID=4465 RepID=A0AAV9EYJ2_ACOCL|nr:hypothetical protein QJS10_CPB04g00075 [Acorus calamus]
MPLVAEDQYLEIIKDRILLLQQSTDIETRYKLMKFFAENEYGKHYPAIRNEWLYRDEGELDKILCGIVNYPDDNRIVNNPCSIFILFSLYIFVCPF